MNQNACLEVFVGLETVDLNHQEIQVSSKRMPAPGLRCLGSLEMSPVPQQKGILHLSASQAHKQFLLQKNFLRPASAQQHRIYLNNSNDADKKAVLAFDRVSLGNPGRNLL